MVYICLCVLLLRQVTPSLLYFLTLLYCCCCCYHHADVCCALYFCLASSAFKSSELAWRGIWSYLDSYGVVQTRPLDSTCTRDCFVVAAIFRIFRKTNSYACGSSSKWELEPVIYFLPTTIKFPAKGRQRKQIQWGPFPTLRFSHSPFVL